MRVSGIALATVLASAAVGAGFGLRPVLQRHLPDPAPVTLGGRVPSQDVALTAWLDRRAELEGRTEVLVRHPDGVLVVPRKALGLALDTESARVALERPREPRSLFARLRILIGGTPPEPLDVPPSYR